LQEGDAPPAHIKSPIVVAVLIGQQREIGLVRRPGAQDIIKPRFDHGPVGATAPSLIVGIQARDLPILLDGARVKRFRGLAIANGICLDRSVSGGLAPNGVTSFIASPFRLNPFDTGKDLARVGQPFCGASGTITGIP
jgi:hypothetical protein